MCKINEMQVYENEKHIILTLKKLRFETQLHTKPITKSQFGSAVHNCSVKKKITLLFIEPHLNSAFPTQETESSHFMLKSRNYLTNQIFLSL